MASIGHLLVGFALSRVPASGSRGQRAVVLMAAAMLPDLDVVGFPLGIAYGSDLGHRGASHSLVFAALCGGAAALVAGRRWGALVAAAVASHPLLDALTDGGLGVALWWPMSSERVFAPWNPLPVAPIGPRFLSSRGLSAILGELAWLWPLLLIGLSPAGRAPAACPRPPSR